jgi:RimJ/RimL family protein N-acetyltransferase
VNPVTLERDGVRLEPLTPDHRDGLAAAAADGRLWELWFTSVPEPDQTAAYIATALAGQQDGHMVPWVVRERSTGDIIGSTRYHDIVAAIDRVEIGYTWYAKRWQRSHVNTTCKLMLLEHAFDTLGAKVVGLRTDGFNTASQRAIEALGAKKDGVLRHHQSRRDGSARDSVMYSILAAEWPDVRRRLEERLARHHVRIETFRPEHQPAFAALNREWLVGYGLIEPHDEEQLGDPFGHIIEPGGQIFVAMIDGTVVGTCAAIPYAPDAVELAKLAVDPAARGRGIGHRLVDACLAYARDRGASRVVLLSNSRLTAALRLYESYGFQPRPVPASAPYVSTDVYMERVICPNS